MRTITPLRSATARETSSQSTSSWRLRCIATARITSLSRLLSVVSSSETIPVTVRLPA
jgi:hypothetical protein